MAPVRVVRAFRLPITAIVTALALSGCMRTTGPVAGAPQGDLDSMAYGQPNSPPPQAVAADSRAGAIRRGLSSRCRRQAARRCLWPGRPDQHLRDRRRRLDHDAADRLGAG